jgi:hypothetical protein
VIDGRATVLTFQGQTSGVGSNVEFYSKDGDGTDNVGFNIFGTGTPASVTNSDYLEVARRNSADATFPNRYIIGSQSLGTGTVQPITLFTGANTSQLVLATDGNVGIGTTNPLELLSVYKSQNSATRILVRNPNTSASAAAELRANSDAGNFYVGIQSLANTKAGAAYLWNDANTPLIMVTNNIEQARISNTGNLGLGTTNPTDPLYISRSGASVRNRIRLETTGSDTDQDNQITFSDAGEGKHWSIGAKDTNDVFRISNNEDLGTTTRLTIDASGNVGIGNTAPTKLLHVGSATVASGTAVANFQNADGTCTITPAASGSGIACSSDERLKENFEDVQGAYALDHLLKLQAYTYNFKTSSPENRHTGYKAQDVQKIAPEFVRQNDDGYLQVYYDAFIPWITEAIKSLYNRITGVMNHQVIQDRQIASKADKTETEALKAENERLKQENAAIKAYLCGKDPSAGICH